jgi:choline dehydrogenase-like flavoprotein
MEYKKAHVYIIGSGLSAVAAASALVKQGCRPIVLDTGLTSDPEAQQLKQRLSVVEPDCWCEEDIEQLKRIGPVSANGIPRKLSFGSDYSFREAHFASPIEASGALTPRSFAMGGFSNVWGAVIQRLSAKELEDWPITLADLVPHYAAVEALWADQREDASTEINSYPSELRPSVQAQALYSDLDANRKALEAEGIRFDYARLGVHSLDHNGQQSCRYCGLCLYGCPYDCTHNSGATLTQFVKEGLIQYVPGVLVDKLIPGGNQVGIEARCLTDGTKRTFHASRLLLAAGVLETARIVLVSLGLFNTAVRMKQSDIFTLPLLRYHKIGDVFSEKLHTLCQLAAKVEDKAICEHNIHLQFYGYNDLYLKILMQKAAGIAPCIAPLLRTMIARIFIIFGYLHSNVSSEIEIKLSSDGARLLAKGIKNPATDRIVRKVARKIFQNRRSLKGLPLFWGARIDLPGGSYHAGGTFPMRRVPEFLETDRWGRLSSLPRVSIVDASVLPSISASTIAYTVMANAHRIAAEFLKADE